MPEPATDLQALIEQLIPARVRASGFPPATSIVCTMGDPTEWRTFAMALDEVHDPHGLVAHAAHEQDRSPEAAAAFDRLAAAMQLELSELSEVAPLELGQWDDYPYWGPVEVHFDPDGITYRLTELDGPFEAPEEEDSEAPSQLPTVTEVADLEARLVDALRSADAETAREAERLTAQIIDHLRSTEPPGIARLEVEVEQYDCGWPSTSIWGVLDAEGNQLEIDIDAEEVDGLVDYVGLTRTIGGLTIDVNAGTIS